MNVVIGIFIYIACIYGLARMLVRSPEAPAPTPPPPPPRKDVMG